MSLKKLVTIATTGFIPEIKVTGPVKTPTYIKIDAVKTLVLNGRRVYEHNPSNPSEKVLLQPSTYAKVNFGSNDAAPVEPTQVEEPKNDPIPEQVTPAEDPAPVAEPEAPETDVTEEQKSEEAAPVEPTQVEEPKNDPIPEQVTPAEDPAPVAEPEAPETEKGADETAGSKTEEVAPTPQSQNNNQQKSKKDKKNKR